MISTLLKVDKVDDLSRRAAEQKSFNYKAHLQSGNDYQDESPTSLPFQGGLIRTPSPN
jgi:hypothetical protein